MLIAILASTLLTSCVKDKFDTPEPTPDVDPNLAVNLSIDELKNLYTGSSAEITGDYIISGTVISDDSDGNVYQTLIIQDSTGGVGFRIQRTDLFTDFPFGRKVYVKLKGLWIGAYNNLIQVGAGDDGQGSVTLIPAAFVDSFFVKGPRNQTVTPLEIAIPDLSSRYQNTLIKLKNVQFQEGQAGVSTYADAVNHQAESTVLEDCDGNKIEIRTSGYAKFAGTTLPGGKGDVVAIYQIFKTSNQLLLNKSSDVQLDGERCDTGGNPTDTTSNDAPSSPDPSAVLLFPGSDFENWSDFQSSINSFGIKSYATQATGTGHDGSNALSLNGTPGGNDYVFTIAASDNAKFPAGATRLSFYVKGTAAKSLSINVYSSTGDKTYYNIEDLTENKLVTSSENNQYTGTINTNGNWVLVTLDLTGAGLNSTNSGDLFALKVGKNAAYDLLIDDIKVW